MGIESRNRRFVPEPELTHKQNTMAHDHWFDDEYDFYPEDDPEDDPDAEHRRRMVWMIISVILIIAMLTTIIYPLLIYGFPVESTPPTPTPLHKLGIT